MPSESKDDFDGYRKWLNIRGRRRPPSHYELLGIRLDENDQEVIQSAIDQRRSFIDSKRGEGHDDLVAEILMRLDEAQVTLFSHEMRRDYDKRLKLFKKRRLLRRLEFDWLPDPYRTQLQRAVGEEPEIVKTFAGIMAVLTVCFAAMAWFSFRLPWNGATEEPPMSVAVVEENKPPVPIPQPQVAAPAKVDDSPKQEDPKPAKSESSVAAKPSSTSLANLSSSSSKGEAPKPPQRRIIGAERVLRGHSAEIHFMTLSPDGQLIASAANDRSVRLWDLKSGRQIWSAACGKSDFKALDFHSSNKQIFVADSSAAYKIDVATGESKEVVKFTATGQACFGNNCSVIAHESKGTLTIHDTGKGKELAKSKDYIPAMSFDRDARLLVIGGWEGSGVVRARRLRDKKSVGEFRGLRDRTMAVQLSPDERLVAASSGCAKPEQNPAQNKVMVWDTSTGNPVLERTFEEGWCYAIAFSPDSKLLAAGGAASTSDWGGYSSPDKNLVRIWNIGGGAERCTLSGHRASVKAIAFAPDGDRLVTASLDQTIRIWHLEDDASSDGIDTQVAEWVLAKGGKIKIRKGEQSPIEITAKWQLTSSPYSIVSIDLTDKKEIHDGELQRFKKLSDLEELTLAGTSITDQGLKEVGEVAKLKSLNVAGTAVNGAGFPYLTLFGKLETLLCGGSQVNDANLLYLQRCQRLSILGLIGTRVTDAGMPILGRMPSLKELRLSETKITNKGANQLKGLTGLERLLLAKTKVTKPAVDALKVALPKCQIQAD